MTFDKPRNQTAAVKRFSPRKNTEEKEQPTQSALFTLALLAQPTHTHTHTPNTFLEACTFPAFPSVAQMGTFADTTL